MTRNLNYLATFAALAETGSFAGAARRLRLPASTVSEHIAALEKSLGVQLVIRTTRQNRLTEAGKILARGSAKMMETVAETLSGIEALIDQPKGNLRLSLPFAFAADIVAPSIARFAMLYPGIRLEITVSNEIEDLIAGGFDLAVRIGLLDDSTLTRRSLGTMQQDLVASRAYLDMRGRPDKLADLANHRIIGFQPMSMFHVQGPGGYEKLTLETQVAVNDPKTLLSIIRAGAGIGAVPRFLTQAGLDDASLEIILPVYRLPPAHLSIVYYGSGSANPRADLFARFLQSELQSQKHLFRR